MIAKHLGLYRWVYVWCLGLLSVSHFGTFHSDHFTFLLSGDINDNMLCMKCSLYSCFHKFIKSVCQVQCTFLPYIIPKVLPCHSWACLKCLLVLIMMCPIFFNSHFVNSATMIIRSVPHYCSMHQGSSVITVYQHS